MGGSRTLTPLVEEEEAWEGGLYHSPPRVPHIPRAAGSPFSAIELPAAAQPPLEVARGWGGAAEEEGYRADGHGEERDLEEEARDAAVWRRCSSVYWSLKGFTSCIVKVLQVP